MSEVEWDEGREISQDEIKYFENRLGICLPDDFKKIIAVYDGGNPSPNVIDFSGMVEKVFTGLIPLLKENDYNQPILEIIKMYSDRLPEGIVPIGDDPFGNMYCYDFRANSKPVIVYWNHELDMDDPKQFVFVANSFSELMDSFYSPE